MRARLRRYTLANFEVAVNWLASVDTGDSMRQVRRRPSLVPSAFGGATASGTAVARPPARGGGEDVLTARRPSVPFDAVEAPPPGWQRSLTGLSSGSDTFYIRESSKSTVSSSRARRVRLLLGGGGSESVYTSDSSFQSRDFVRAGARGLGASVAAYGSQSDRDGASSGGGGGAGGRSGRLMSRSSGKGHAGAAPAGDTLRYYDSSSDRDGGDGGMHSRIGGGGGDGARGTSGRVMSRSFGGRKGGALVPASAGAPPVVVRRNSLRWLQPPHPAGAWREGTE